LIRSSLSTRIPTLRYNNLTGLVTGLVTFRGPIHLCECGPMILCACVSDCVDVDRCTCVHVYLQCERGVWDGEGCLLLSDKKRVK